MRWQASIIFKLLTHTLHSSFVHRVSIWRESVSVQSWAVGSAVSSRCVALTSKIVDWIQSPHYPNIPQRHPDREGELEPDLVLKLALGVGGDIVRGKKR